MGIPISNVPRRVVYAASGTGPYNFTFEILANTDIAVYRDDTLLTLTTNYTVTINTNGTGYVTLTAAPTGATQIAIVGNRTISRSTDFTTGGDFFANTLNDELDQQTIFNQQNAEGLQRALQAPQTDPIGVNMTLPRSAERAGRYLAFDPSGNPTVAGDITIVYQGAKASNPTVRNNGEPLQAGDLYFNTGDIGLRVYTGTAWVVAVNATDPLVERRFVATSGQTTATFTGGYRVGFLYVFVNGVMLDTTDITATDGTTVTFASALALNDEVRMLSFKAAGSLGLSDISGAAGTANAVAFLNGSKILSTSSALTFDGSALSVTGTMKSSTTIGVGNATPSASGAGVTFPASQSSSTNANTLDDYEEGTFTPTITGTTTAGTGSYNTFGQVGIYTKVGRMVTVQIWISWSSHTGTGDMRISGLPFANNSTIAAGATAAISPSNIALTTNNVMTARCISNTTNIEFQQYPAGGGLESTVPMDTSGSIGCSLTYSSN